MIKFKESKLAHLYLDGMKGVEIGGGAHNPFGLDTINVDRYGDMNTVSKMSEADICGEKMTVDVVANGDELPFKDNEFDFVVSSHVIEHFYDPIKALKEWSRVARKYIFIIVPHKDRTFDSERPETSVGELISRHSTVTDLEDKHWSVWTPKSFMELMNYLGMDVVELMDADDKVGNGFAIVIKL